MNIKEFIDKAIKTKVIHRDTFVHGRSGKNEDGVGYCSHNTIKSVMATNPKAVVYDNGLFGITSHDGYVYIYPSAGKGILAVNNDNGSKFFAVNFDSRKEYGTALPLGVLEGHMEYLEKARSIECQKNDLIYNNFSIHTNVGHRQPISEYCKKNEFGFSGPPNGLPWEEYRNHLDSYFSHVYTSKYSFCPWGMGKDTLRFWECLYLGTIPIVQRSPLYEQFKDSGLPVLIYDDIEEITQEYLMYQYDKF